jgi:hypothetical protein
MGWRIHTNKAGATVRRGAVPGSPSYWWSMRQRWALAADATWCGERLRYTMLGTWDRFVSDWWRGHIVGVDPHPLAAAALRWADDAARRHREFHNVEGMYPGGLDPARLDDWLARIEEVPTGIAHVRALAAEVERLGSR